MVLKAIIKRRTLAITLAILFIAGGIAAYYGARHIVRQRAWGWRQNGIAASVAGNHTQAVDLLVRYLRRSPRDVEALTYYVKSRELAEMPNGQHLAETIAALKILLRLDPARMDDRRHLLELYFALDRLPEAMDTANAILAKLPNDLRTLEIKTDSHIRLHDYREALTVAAKWASLAPLNLQAQMTRLSLRTRLDHSAQEIIADAQKLREAHPDDARFEILQGFAYAQVGNNEQAIQWLKTAVKHTNPNDEFAKTLLMQLDSLGQSEESVNLLQTWVKNGADREVRYTLARRYWEQNRWQQVVDTLADLNLQDAATDSTLIALKAIALANLQKAPEAAACREVLAKRDQPAARAWVLLLSRIIDSADINDKQLIAECQAALMRDPHNLYLAYFLGEASARLGESDLAIEAWRRVSMENFTWSAPAVRLADLLLSKGQLHQALDIAVITARRNPTSPAAIVTLARAWSAGIETGRTGSSDELLKLVSDIQRQLPGEERSLSIQIQLLAQKGRKNEAIAAARLGLDRVPPLDAQFFLSLSGISRKFSLGLEGECFDRCEKSHGLTAPLAYARAVHLAASGRGPEGLKLFDELAKRANKPADLNWQLARVQYLDITEDPGAKAAWVALADAQPQNLTVQQAAVNARCLRGDWSVMERSIDRLRALTGEKGLAWRIAQARLMVESPRNEADYVQGSVLLTSIVQAFPAQPEPRILLAKALIRMGRMDGAIEHLSVAAKLDPTSVPVALQLASLLQSRGDFERVRHELDRVAPQLQAPEQRRQAALMLAQTGQSDRAIQMLEDAKTETEGGKADILLAHLYRQRRQLDKAEAIVVKLLEQQPDLATIQFAVSLYLSQDRRSDAEKVLNRLDSLKLDPGVKEMAWASFYGQINDLKEAAKRYHLATRQAPQNPAAWRSLAACCIILGQINEAMTFIDEALRALPDDKSLQAIKQQSPLLAAAASDDTLRAVVLSVMRDPLNSAVGLELLRTVVEIRRTFDMEHLAAKLQQLAERNPSFQPVQIQIIQCYWNMGRPGEALAAAQRIMGAFPADPEPTRIAVVVAQGAGRWQEMLTAAQAWKRRTTESPIPAEIAAARALIGLKQYAGAAAQLQPYLEIAQKAPDDHMELLTVYAAALASNKPQSAADLLWPLVQKSAIWRSSWAAVAVQSLDAQQGAAWLERLAAIIPADAIEDRVMLAEHYDRLGRRLNHQPFTDKSSALFTQLAADPQATGPALMAAGLQAERCEDFPAAEERYRRAIEKDPKLLVALNNLSLLIARRGGDMKQAVAYANAALKLQPRQATIYDTVAQVHAKAADPKSAADLMRIAVKLEPDSGNWRIRLAQYLFDAGQFTEARQALDAMAAARIDSQRLPKPLRDQLESLRQQIRLKGKTT